MRLKYLRRGNCDRSRKTGDSNHKALHFGSRKDAHSADSHVRGIFVCTKGAGA